VANRFDKITTSDACEIYCALCTADYIEQDENPSLEALKDKIGPDGENLAAGDVRLSAADLRIVRMALNGKLSALQSGQYDDYKGECQKQLSTTGRWQSHLRNILVKLCTIVTSESGNLDVAFYFVPALALLSAARGIIRTFTTICK